VRGGIVSKAGLVPEVVLAGSDGSVASVKTGSPQEIKISPTAINLATTLMTIGTP